MPIQCTVDSVLYLNERESAQLAEAVRRLVTELGFEPEEINRSYRESFEYFLKQS